MKAQVKRRFFLFCLFTIVINLSFADAQSVLDRLGKRVEKRVKDRVEKKVNEQVDKTVDNALDKTEETITGSKKKQKTISLDELGDETTSFSTNAQTTQVASGKGELFFPSQEGAVLELSIYNAKDKLTGKTKQVVRKVEKTNKGTTLYCQSEHSDSKGKVLNAGELVMRFEKNVFYADLRNLLDPQGLKVLGMDGVKITSSDLAFPGKLKVGQRLPNANLTITMQGSEIPMPPTTITVSNRKVLAIEKVDCPAGTFECYKISSETNIQSIIDKTMHNIEWMAPGVGTVRTESYNSKGKLLGKSILTTYRK